MEETQHEEVFGEEFTILIDKKQTPLRLDKFLQGRIFNSTRNKVQLAIKNGAVLINDNQVKSNYKVRPGDIVTGIIPKKREAGRDVIGEDIPLEIVYEDDDVMVINKPAGMVVHPGISNYTGTLVNALKFYFDNKDLPVMKGNDDDRPGIVHRIDKFTTGLLLIAKNDEAMTKLAKQFFDHSIERNYLALVWGNFDETKGSIDVNVGRSPKNRKVMTTFDEGDEGKRAITHFEVIEDMYYVSLVNCSLETGRTHQIRVHMKSLGHPIFNDDIYGGDSIVKGTVFTKYKQFVQNCFKLMPGFALHAHTLGFIHPSTGEKMTFKVDLPEDFANTLEKWRKYVNSRKENFS